MRIILISLVILMTSSSASLAQSGKIKMGAPFPTLQFPSLQDGKPMSIADFRGKKTILHLFASW